MDASAGLVGGYGTNVYVLAVLVPTVVVVVVWAWHAGLHASIEDVRRRMGVSRPFGAGLLGAGIAGPVAAVVLGGVPLELPVALPFVGATIVYEVGLTFVGLAAGRTSRFRLVRRASPPESGGTASPGDVVEVEGEAVPVEAPAEAPITGDPCLAYRYTVEGTRLAFPRRVWATNDAGRGGVPFEVRGCPGSVVVDPDGGTFHLVDGVLVTDGADGEVRESLRDAMPLSPRPDAGVRERSREARLEPGETAYVAGEVVHRTTAGDGSLPVVADGSVPPLVADLSGGRLKRDFRFAVLFGGPAGAAATVAGLWWLLAGAGVL